MRDLSLNRYDCNKNKKGSALGNLNALDDKLENFTRHIDDSVEAIENILEHEQSYYDNEQRLEEEKEMAIAFIHEKSMCLNQIDTSLKHSESRTTFTSLPLLSDFTETCRTLHSENAKQLLYLEQAFANLQFRSNGNKHKDVVYTRHSSSNPYIAEELEEEYCLEEGTVDVNSDRLKSTISIYSQSLEGMLFGDDRDHTVCQTLGIGQPLDRLSEETHDSSSTTRSNSMVSARENTVCIEGDKDEDKYAENTDDDYDDDDDSDDEETLDETLESNGSTVLAERKILKHLDITYLENVNITNDNDSSENHIILDDCISLPKAQSKTIDPAVKNSSQAPPAFTFENDEDNSFYSLEETNKFTKKSSINSNQINENNLGNESDNQKIMNYCEETNLNISKNTNDGNDFSSSSSFATDEQSKSSMVNQVQPSRNDNNIGDEITHNLKMLNNSISDDERCVESNNIGQNASRVKESSCSNNMDENRRNNNEQDETNHSQHININSHYKTPLNTHILDRFQVQVLEGGSEIKVSPIEDGVLSSSFFQSPIAKSYNGNNYEKHENNHYHKDLTQKVSQELGKENDKPIITKDDKSSFINHSRKSINDHESLTSFNTNSSEMYEGPLIDKHPDKRKVYRKTPARKKTVSVKESFKKKEDRKTCKNFENKMKIGLSILPLSERQSASQNETIAFYENALKDITNISLDSMMTQSANISKEKSDSIDTDMKKSAQTLTKKSSFSMEYDTECEKKVYPKTPVTEKLNKDEFRNEQINLKEKRGSSKNIMIPALKKLYVKTPMPQNKRTNIDDCSNKKESSNKNDQLPDFADNKENVSTKVFDAISDSMVAHRPKSTRVSIDDSDHNNESTYCKDEMPNAMEDKVNISSRSFQNLSTGMRDEDSSEQSLHRNSDTLRSYPRTPIPSKPFAENYSECQTPKEDKNCDISPNSLSRTPLAEAWIKKHMKQKDKKRLLDVLNNSNSRTSRSPTQEVLIASKASPIISNNNKFILDPSNGSVSVKSSGIKKVGDGNAAIHMSPLTYEEYEAAPRVVKMQVSIEDVNVSINLLNEGIYSRLQSTDSVSESDANHVLEQDFHDSKKRKFILLSLCHWKRLVLHISPGNNERKFIIAKK